ncbi:MULTISPECIES: dihydroorotase [unclassified Fibrobacter]|uniref:dihydroorotase n=1 Tax=unclassified Fibrobacter TaxID=2634177 RepID=UPI0009107826|nr:MULTISPECIES: dihydroorotase [unclassified Fibrobacter]MCQ2099205.1 dihydroorotase [Fibrobacter sp.]MDO4946233.1 dihydroorotase [Fibrobacter sp.]OWV07456.1 dihydroorotase [Fibrobacter sp. UWH1]SHK25668.1 dihydroorotase [Fibrobacter sp. UWH6]
MNKPNVMNNVVLKNVRMWDGKQFVMNDKVAIADGYLADKNYFDNASEPAAVVDCEGALAIPALFALGVDFQEPLRDDVYTIKDGINAMRKGGFYGALYESAANPVDDSEKLAALENRLAGKDLKFAVLGAYSVEFGSDHLAEMMELAEGSEELDVCGVAGFGDGNASIPSTRFMRLAMEYGKMTGKRFFFQPMDKTLRKSGCVHEGAYSDMLGMKGIPRIAETISAYTVLELARFLQVPVHFKQVTCGETLDLIRDARKKGIDVTCDVNIYHLMFDDSILTTLDSAYHVLPPFRAATDREALWAGLADGTVNAISMNHTPILHQDKDVNFEDSLPGAVSLEVALPAIWKELVARLGEAKTIELLSTAPAKIAGVEPDAKRVNLVVLSEKSHVVKASEIAGHVCNTPLLGKEVPATIIGSYIGGVWTE